MSSKEESLQSMNRRVKNTGQENRKYEQHFACVALKTLQQTKPTPLGFDLLSQKSQYPQRASFFYFFLTYCLIQSKPSRFEYVVTTEPNRNS